MRLPALAKGLCLNENNKKQKNNSKIKEGSVKYVTKASVFLDAAAQFLTDELSFG